jgi:succinate dehydrogenase/fumarate reductase flavoprotein subunit
MTGEAFMREVDVVVLGSGAAGLAAAATAAALGGAVLILESNDRWGGTSAISGGGLWVPDNPFMAEHGKQDSEQDALTYLEYYRNPGADPQLIRAYLRRCVEAVQFLDAHSPTRFRAMGGPTTAPLRPEPSFTAPSSPACSTRLRWVSLPPRCMSASRTCRS